MCTKEKHDVALFTVACVVLFTGVFVLIAAMKEDTNECVKMEVKDGASREQASIICTSSY